MCSMSGKLNNEKRKKYQPIIEKFECLELA
jgi:hypothetical protein